MSEDEQGADSDAESEVDSEVESDADREAESGSVIDERVTSPMQAFGSREVTIGLLVLFVGMALTFLLPFLF